jgi:hypothetical protein
MTPLRASALLWLALLLLAAPAAAEPTAEWYSNTGGGGALAQPPEQGPSGGSVAPVGGSDRAEPKTPRTTGDDPEPAPAPLARPAQAEPELGAPGEDPAPTSQNTSPGRRAVAGQAAAGQDAGAGDTIGSLPFTGLELAAMLGVGLALIAAGAALRPRRTH